MIEFECLFCEKKYPADPFRQSCPECGETMLVSPSRQPKKIHSDNTASLEKFIDFLPLSSVNPEYCLGEDNMPLIRLPSLSHKYGLPETYAKTECQAPTGSFKDRGTVVAVHMAAVFGCHKIGTVSTGNMGISTAAYGARVGMQTFVFIKHDASQEKLLSAGVHGTNLIKVKGDYGKLAHLSFDIGRKHSIYFMNSTDPFRVEGYKIIGLEIFAEMSPNMPNYIFVPASSGAHLIGFLRVFQELKELGMIDRRPFFVGVQAAGSAPIAEAFAAGKEKFTRWESVNSVAQSITNPDPPGGNLALKLIREMNGRVIAVSDEEILSAQQILARSEGIFCLPASATTLAGMLKLQREKQFRPKERAVLILTGSGVKNPKILDPSKMNLQEAPLSELDSLIGGKL